MQQPWRCVCCIRQLTGLCSVQVPAGFGTLVLPCSLLRRQLESLMYVSWCLQVLAGFGTVEFPYSVLRAFVVPVTAYEVQALTTQLDHVRAQACFPSCLFAACSRKVCLGRYAAHARPRSGAPFLLQCCVLHRCSRAF